MWQNHRLSPLVAHPEIALEPYMLRRPPIGFDTVRLHKRSENAWAVVERPTGAIATGKSGELLMRMTQGEARELALAMTLRLAPEERPESTATERKKST